MSMTCRVCASPHKADIEAAIEASVPIAEIIRKYPISRSSITHHKQICFPVVLSQRAMAQYHKASSDDMLSSLLDTRDRAKGRLDEAPPAYWAQVARVANEADTTLLKAYMEAERLRMDREKLDMAKAGRGGDMRAKLADYMRRHHATACPTCGESIERWLRECPE